MSDLKGLEISDIFGLSEPLTKLVETVSCGVGKLYEPTHIRRLAKAKAEEIKLISDTVTDNLNLPISYQNGEIGIDATDANGLVQRAQNRFLFQQMKKQQNIEAVVANAAAELDKATVVSSTPVDEDWISSFFDFVANVSSNQMQEIWGKLLAGEVSRPGSFSIRTIDMLRKLTQQEAKLFTEIAPLVLRCAGDEEHSFNDYFLLTDTTEEKILTQKYGYTFPQMVILMEAGLLSSNGEVTVGLNTKTNDSMIFEGKNHTIVITNKNNHDVLIAHDAYLLTESGKELFSIIANSNPTIPQKSYFEDCARAIIECKWLISEEDQKQLIWQIQDAYCEN